MKKAIILANGQAPKKSVFNILTKLGYSTLICADGGANTALKLKLDPDFIIGDFDSIMPATQKYYAGNVKMIKIMRQNDTDVEKCLKFAIKKKYDDVILLGSTGDRLDHSFCNLGIALKYYDHINIRIIHGKSILTVYSGKVNFDAMIGETISLYGISTRTKIKSQGLKYLLKNISLPFGEKESTSNVAINNQVKLNIKYGKIFVIRDFEIMARNGHL